MSTRSPHLYPKLVTVPLPHAKLMLRLVLSPHTPDAKEKNSMMLTLNVCLLGSRHGGVEPILPSVPQCCPI